MSTIIILALIGLLTPKQVLVERAFFVMGTNLEFKVYCQDEQVCNKAIFEAYSEVKKLDDIFSNYKDDSVLSDVNSRAGQGRDSVPQEFVELTNQAISFSELTDGTFDITVGKAMELWKAGAEENALPGADDIEKVSECVGFRKVKLFPKEKQIELKSPCISLDFGAIGKGYAVDKAVAVLKGYGIEKGIVNFSGNVYAMEPPPGEGGWDIGVRHPKNGRSALTSIKVKNMAVSTSGDYEKYFKINGIRFSHIIDPRSLLPVKSVPSVTVISKSATEADALSTAFSVMGKNRTFELLEGLNSVGVMMITEKENKLSVYKSPFFKKFEVPYSQPEGLGAKFKYRTETGFKSSYRNHY